MEAVAIAVIVLFAVVLGFIQEYRAERAIEALRQMAAPTVTVIRDGQEIEIPARELVPGDVILLHAGDKVAADARLLESINLHVDEAALTGESVPVTKATKALRGEDMALGDRNNMVFGGTIATYGRGRAVVVGTGMRTQFGRIAQMLQSVETGRTPLQQNLDKVGRVLGKAARRDRSRCRRGGRAPRPTRAGDAHLRDRPSGSRSARGPAGRGHHLIGDWRAADGETKRARAAPAGRGNLGKHVRDLLRQDRHTHQGRDDGPQAVHGGTNRRRLRERLRAARRALGGRCSGDPFPARGRAAARSRSGFGCTPRPRRSARRLGSQRRPHRRGDHRGGRESWNAQGRPGPRSSQGSERFPSPPKPSA